MLLEDIDTKQEVVKSVLQISKLALPDVLTADIRRIGN